MHWVRSIRKSCLYYDYELVLGSKNGAARIKGKLIKAAEQIRFLPFSGVTVPNEKMAKSGFRMIIVEKYLMFYKIFDEDKKVLIYRILNGRTNYPALMNRLYN